MATGIERPSHGTALGRRVAEPEGSNGRGIQTALLQILPRLRAADRGELGLVPGSGLFQRRQQARAPIAGFLRLDALARHLEPGRRSQPFDRLREG